MTQTRNYSSDSPTALEQSHAQLLTAFEKIVRDCEREAAEAGERKTPWLNSARDAITWAKLTLAAYQALLKPEVQS